MRDRSSSGDFIRGVDSMADKAKRGTKALVRMGFVGLAVMLVVAFWIGRDTIDRQRAYLAWKVFVADLADDITPRRIISIDYEGRTYQLQAQQITSMPEFQGVYGRVLDDVGAAVGYGALAAGMVIAGVFGLALFQGRRRRQDEKLRGGERLDADELIEKMKREKVAGPFCIGRSPSEPQKAVKLSALPAMLGYELSDRMQADRYAVMLPRGAETAHVGICGASRTGKSVTLQIMLNSVAREGHTAVIYDPHLDLFSRYYDPGCGDIVLNPMDDRCPVWTPWAEITHPGDADAIAESFIPDRPNSNNPYFDQAARLIFVAALLRLPPERRNAGDLVESLLSLSNEEIQALAGKLEAGRLMDAKSADEVRASLAVGIRALKYLRAGVPAADEAVYRSRLGEWKAQGRSGAAPVNPGIGWSLTQWIKAADQRQPVQGERFRRRPWVWIIARGDHQAAIRPLVTTWFDVLSRSVLSMHSDLSRRIFLCVEEMPQIGKVPALSRLLAEGGKFGVSFVAVWQAWAQLEEVWGKNGAYSLLGNFSTFLAFRVEDTSAIPVYVAKFSKVEQREATESLRLGANEDNAVQVSDQKHNREIVHEGELTTLKPLHAFAKLPGQPITMLRQPDPNLIPFLPPVGAHARQLDMPVEATVYGRLLSDPVAPTTAPSTAHPAATPLTVAGSDL
jgi:type IV secretory pathway TraG/TraD family ATPase VirD4